MWPVACRLMIRLLLVSVLTAALTTACVQRPAADATGEEVYLQVCARCHDADLGGGIGPPVGAGSPAVEMDDDFLATIIHDGRGRMPSFSQTLTDDQITRVVDHLRNAQAGP